MRSTSSAPILPLTSLRFFAAIYVVLLHSAMLSHHLDTSTWGGRFIRSGYTAVGFFFVLSGYILAYVYNNSGLPFSRRSFWIARFARAYPLLIGSLLLDLPHDLAIRVSLHGTVSGILRSTVELLSECALLQSWDGYFRNINAPSWSLSAEAFFYLLFPFVSFWIWRRKGKKAMILIVLLWLCSLVAPLVVTLKYPMLFKEVSTSRLQLAVELMPIFRMFEFFAGIALCSVQVSLVERLSPVQTKRLAEVCLVSAVCFFVTVIQCANYIPLLVMSNGLLLPASALLILGATNIRGRFADLLSVRPLVILGESSYAVYLLHMPVWFYFQTIWPIKTISAWMLYIGVLICLSIGSFMWFERPIRKKILSLSAIRSPVTLDEESASAR